MKHFVGLASLKRWTISSHQFTTGLILVGQDIAIGTWRTHYSYNDARHIVKTSDKIFCATQNGFFSRDLASGETRKLSKIDGLSDAGITALAYSPSQNVLVIGYASGFIDFVFESQIISLDDLATSNLDIDKRVNDIAFGPNETYLATDIGILVVDTERAVITENFVNIGIGGAEVSVEQVVYRDQALIIKTTEGIQRGLLDRNLLDFSNWDRLELSGTISNLTLVEDDLFATDEGRELVLVTEEIIDTGVALPVGATKLFATDSQLLTADKNGAVYRFSGDSFLTLFSSESQSINGIVQYESTFFIADQDNGLVDQEGNSFIPDGPVSDQFSNFRLLGGEVFGFHSPSPFSYDGTIQQPYFSVFSEGQWMKRNIDGFNNVSDAINFNNTLYFSSIGDGLYNDASSEIITNIPGSSAPFDTIITALASGDRLWVSSFRNSNPIHLLGEEGWTSYSSLELFDDDFLTIDLSRSGIGWLGSASGTITVVDAVENDSDLISVSDGLPSSFIDIEISIEDEAWVATTRGPALFPDASFVFLNSDALQPTFENRVLFDGEQINAVMTDGGNRIWFGTENGIWVYDENTSEQVAVFNETNSPLPSNRIIQMAYNGRNGEVFIYTDQGMVSYRSASSIGNRNHRSVKVFPNPVRQEYQGLVGLTGLARNVSVKITDVNGNLVQELAANGGSASWNLRDRVGSQVSTGIYFFFSSSSDGEETYVGKIAVIR